MAERFADGRATPAQLQRALRRAWGLGPNAAWAVAAERSSLPDVGDTLFDKVRYLAAYIPRRSRRGRGAPALASLLAGRLNLTERVAARGEAADAVVQINVALSRLTPSRSTSSSSFRSRWCLRSGVRRER